MSVLHFLHTRYDSSDFVYVRTHKIDFVISFTFPSFKLINLLLVSTNYNR